MNETGIIALLMSLIFTELTGISPGGIILPMYFVMFLHDPVRITATVMSALIAIAVIKLLSRFAVIYGRRRFALFLVIGIMEKLLFTRLYYGSSFGIMNLSMTIGFLVPGILGSNMEKQGIWKTLVSLCIVVCAVVLVHVLLTGRMI